MKKILVLFLITLTFLLSACQPKVVTYSLDLEEDTINIYIGEAHEIAYIAKANDEVADLTIELDSASKKVTLGDGTITGLSEGTATIMVSLTKDSSIVKTLEVTILNPLVITNEETICFLNETLTLVVDDLRATNHLETLTWSSSNEEVATVVDGVVTGVGNGQATISVENAEGLVATKEITVMYETITGIAINDLEDDVEIFEEVQLTAIVTPSNANQSVTWSTDDEAIATIDEVGLLTAHKVGSVVITATSVANPELKATMTIEVKIDPIAMMASVHDESPINQTVTTYGSTERQQVVYGSVSNYFFAPLNQVEQIAPMTMTGGTGTTNTYVGQTATPTLLTTVEPLKFTRSGILHPDTTYITYHDTGNNTPGADGIMHATYLSGSYNLNDRARSWHYTVDDEAAVHHIPDNEVTWQGDNYTSYAYSIGIETAVDFGSDLYATWHRTAKLIAKLMMEYDIPFENIVQHYTWSGKNCPQTLRRNNLYPKAMEMVLAEYMVAQYLSEYTITLTSLSPEYVDARGRIIALPQTATRVGVLVRITKGDYDESVVLYSNLPGQDATTTPVLAGTTADLEAAQVFDQGVANLPAVVTTADEGDVQAMRIAYNCLTEVQRTLVTTLSYLESKELALHTLNAVATPLVISQIYSSDNTELSHGYVELYNATNQDVSLNGFALHINNGATTQLFTFASTAMIKAHGNYLVQFQETTNVTGTYLPLPDDVSSIHLGKNGYVALTNTTAPIASATASSVVDFVGMGTSTLFEGIATTSANQTELALIRWGAIDTNQNAKDFKSGTPNPHNAAGQAINASMTADEKAARSVDLMIISLPRELVASDQSKVINTRTSYNALSQTAKDLVEKLPLFLTKEAEMEGLLDPNLQAINEAIANMPRHITNDYVLPTTNGITWTYKVGEDTSYFDLATGTYLKLSYEAKPITLVATKNTSSKEIVVNFGVMEAGQTGIFYTGATAPTAGGQTGAGKGTPAEQLAKVGFEGIAMVVDGKVFFVAEKSYIALSAPLSGNTLTIDALRPYGSSSDSTATYNQSLVKGVPTAYAGAGTLYENTSNIDLSFDPSFTYGRNNSGQYGYGKVVFSPNGDGSYTIKAAWENSGPNNTTTNGLTKTLKPGELLWCPHTYETNLNYGTWCTQPSTSTNGTPALGVDKLLKLVIFKTSFPS